jgi:hypothetical protein
MRERSPGRVSKGIVGRWRRELAKDRPSERDRRCSALGKVGGTQIAYIKKPHGLRIHRAVFALIGPNAAVFAAGTAHEDWREQPPFWFVGLLLRKCGTDKERTVGSNHGATL